MKKYYRVMLGQKSMHAAECFAGGFIGVDFLAAENLTGKLSEEYQAFNRRFIPVYQTVHPGHSRIAAGLSCGMLWTVAKGIENGGVVLCPDGTGRYKVCEVTGDYFYEPGGILPHRRPVRWLPSVIERSEMSEGLRKSTGSSGTVCDITHHTEEIERLLAGVQTPALPGDEGPVDDPAAFALEMHLEEFLVANWSHTEFGKEYDIFEEDGELIGQQYKTDTGRIDILAVSKDKKELLVVELKKGRPSDAVVGQVLRYMGYVREELAEEGQLVQGAIVAHEDDSRIRRALSIVPDVGFYLYEVTFRLVKR